MDEYAKPILDLLHDPELATANRYYLHGFYGIIKDCAEHFRFTCVTGVSMFSGLNNLKDISLDPRYATICGYIEDDLDRVFGPELEGGGAQEGPNLGILSLCFLQILLGPYDQPLEVGVP